MNCRATVVFLASGACSWPSGPHLAATDTEFHGPVTTSFERDVFVCFDADHDRRFEASLTPARTLLAA
jgi:hypothetical protein